MFLNATEVFKLAPIAEEMPPERSGGGIGTESGLPVFK